MRAPRTVSARPTGKRKSSEQDCCDRDCAHESLLARKQPRPNVAHSHLMHRSNIAAFEGSPWTAIPTLGAMEERSSRAGMKKPRPASGGTGGGRGFHSEMAREGGTRAFAIPVWTMN